jgi:hypothetical protein
VAGADGIAVRREPTELLSCIQLILAHRIIVSAQRQTATPHWCSATASAAASSQQELGRKCGIEKVPSRSKLSLRQRLTIRW